MRIVLTGKRGQVVTALREPAAPDVEFTVLGRPEFDLAKRESVPMSSSCPSGLSPCLSASNDCSTPP
jgi:hypothetical protein